MKNKVIINLIDVTIYKVDNEDLYFLNNDTLYKAKYNSSNLKSGDDVTLYYEGEFNNEISEQNFIIHDIKYMDKVNTNVTIKRSYLDDGIFSDYYLDAYNYLKNMGLDEKIGQLFLVRYDDSISSLLKYKFAGYVFFSKDFRNKDKVSVKNMLATLQNNSKIPLLTAVDCEGGIVVRISSNKLLSDTPFKSSSDLYKEGGFELIKEDTINKSKLLYNLGINLNLAPVVDVSQDKNDYMYYRTIGLDKTLTSEFARVVIESSKNSGVSYTLKHFPGYGNNIDTHTGSSVDSRTLEDIMNNDIVPFKKGIESGAEAILVSHNIVTSIDSNNPASLSSPIHKLLRDDLDFTGVIITDDLDMGAVTDLSKSTISAIKAGNNLIITTDYKTSIESVKKALEENIITEEEIDELVFKTLAFKYYKKLLD